MTAQELHKLRDLARSHARTWCRKRGHLSVVEDLTSVLLLKVLEGWHRVQAEKGDWERWASVVMTRTARSEGPALVSPVSMSRNLRSRLPRQWEEIEEDALISSTETEDRCWAIEVGSALKEHLSEQDWAFSAYFLGEASAEEMAETTGRTIRWVYFRSSKLRKVIKDDKTLKELLGQRV